MFVIISLFEQRSFKYMLINCGYISGDLSPPGWVACSKRRDKSRLMKAVTSNRTPNFSVVGCDIHPYNYLAPEFQLASAIEIN